MRDPSPLRSNGRIATYSTTQEPAGEVAEQMPPVGPTSLDCLVNNSQYVPVFSFRGPRDPEINDIRKIRTAPFSIYVLPDSATHCEPSKHETSILDKWDL